MPLDVTLVTAGAATADDLTDTDYHDIYTELRQKCTLREFAAMAGVYSFAWWAQFEKFEKPATWLARQALRRLVGLDDLPAPVDVALSEAVDGDAAIYRIGPDGKARRVLLLATSDAVTVRWNGTGPNVVNELQQAARDDVTEVTRQRRRNGLWRPVLPKEWRQRAAVAGVDVRAVVLAAIEHAEADHADRSV